MSWAGVMAENDGPEISSPGTIEAQALPWRLIRLGQESLTAPARIRI